jgi:hypothetical protein
MLTSWVFGIKGLHETVSSFQEAPQEKTGRGAIDGLDESLTKLNKTGKDYKDNSYTESTPENNSPVEPVRTKPTIPVKLDPQPKEQTIFGPRRTIGKRLGTRTETDPQKRLTTPGGRKQTLIPMNSEVPPLQATQEVDKPPPRGPIMRKTKRMVTIADLKKQTMKGALPQAPKGVAPSRAEPNTSGAPVKFAAAKRGFGAPKSVNRPMK